jgi:hypothetical protein
MALQSGQWALVHLNLLDKQLAELGMINARGIMNGTAPTPSENGNKMLINTFEF